MITPGEILENLSYLIMVRDEAGNLVYCNKMIDEIDWSSLEKIGARAMPSKDGKTYYATSYRTKLPLSFDPLTGLLEKNCFQNEIKELTKVCALSHQSYVVAFGDLDHFKQINDSIGHLKADQILKRVAEIIKKNIRSDDFASRFGGDEFLIALKNVGLPEGYKKIEQIRKEIEELEYREVDLHGNPIRIVVQTSFGIAQYEAGKTALEVMHDADMALYDAKQGGRDRVTPFTGRKENYLER